MPEWRLWLAAVCAGKIENALAARILLGNDVAHRNSHSKKAGPSEAIFLSLPPPKTAMALPSEGRESLEAVNIRAIDLYQRWADYFAQACATLASLASGAIFIVSRRAIHCARREDRNVADGHAAKGAGAGERSDR